MKYKKKCTTSIIPPSVSLKVIEKTWYMNDMHKGWSLYKIKQINIEVYNYINVIFGIHRSSPWRCSVKIGILKNFAKFTGKHLFQSLFFNKDSGTGVFQWILQNFKDHLFLINLFLAYRPILKPLKRQKTPRFSHIFRGYKMVTLARNGLNQKT